MALQSWLPSGGQNLFQAIKAKRAEAEAAGISILNLAIGQPQGPALRSAREAAARAVLSEAESMHEYQDNGSPGVPGFAQEFVRFHTGQLSEAEVAYLPIPGIKPMLGLIPLACGCAESLIVVNTTTDPGYPTPADWCQYLPNVGTCALRLNPANNFRFTANNIGHKERGQTLVMMNYPHNPSGQVATAEWLWSICRYCEQEGIRLFNDAAYLALSHDWQSSSLAAVAVKFPGLSWAEAFSASKLIGNGTGWRVGAMVGSWDFITDVARIKGNTDSGFAAPLAAGVLEAIRHDSEAITRCRLQYKERIGLLTSILQARGMELAVQPGAGFFTLWKTPTQAFGQKIASAQEFNFLMIEHTGVLGVHFNPYIRYAVCDRVEDMARALERAFEAAQVSYN